jgi:ppGpp synthetase/RelA/SpoT-type nucleotidyltranferase
MGELNRASKRFLTEYAAQISAAESATEIAGAIVERTVREVGAPIHAITARAKNLDSLRGKLRRKEYKKPGKELTDLIGVRVISYYSDSVDTIAERLEQTFEINKKESTDKRRGLGLRDFGYRSVHLIARLKAGHQLTAEGQFLRDRWFEIQIRSVLEHAWAEIEHEVVYKSGIKHTCDTTRRFAALAGTLELLDGEFLALRKEHDLLVEKYKSSRLLKK